MSAWLQAKYDSERAKFERRFEDLKALRQRIEQKSVEVHACARGGGGADGGDRRRGGCAGDLLLPAKTLTTTSLVARGAHTTALQVQQANRSLFGNRSRATRALDENGHLQDYEDRLTRWRSEFTSTLEQWKLMQDLGYLNAPGLIDTLASLKSLSRTPSSSTTSSSSASSHRTTSSSS